MWRDSARDPARASAGWSRGLRRHRSRARQGAAIRRQSRFQTLTSGPPARRAGSPRSLRLASSLIVPRSPLSCRQLRPDPAAPPDRASGCTVLDPNHEWLTNGKPTPPPIPLRHLPRRAPRSGLSFAGRAGARSSSRASASECLRFVNLCPATCPPKALATVREHVEHELARLQGWAARLALMEAANALQPIVPPVEPGGATWGLRHVPARLLAAGAPRQIDGRPPLERLRGRRPAGPVCGSVVGRGACAGWELAGPGLCFCGTLSGPSSAGAVEPRSAPEGAIGTAPRQTRGPSTAAEGRRGRWLIRPRRRSIGGRRAGAGRELASARACFCRTLPGPRSAKAVESRLVPHRAPAGSRAGGGPSLRRAWRGIPREPPPGTAALRPCGPCLREALRAIPHRAPPRPAAGLRFRRWGGATAAGRAAAMPRWQPERGPREGEQRDRRWNRPIACAGGRSGCTAAGDGVGRGREALRHVA
jgi:hypothetical protein